MKRRALLVFVKYPEPGRVKTRLAAAVGPEQAAVIYRRLAEAVFAKLPRDVDVRVLFDPPDCEAEFTSWLGAWTFERQADGDLGVRLATAFAEAFARGYHQVAAIGTDCIELDAETFRETWAALEAHELVLGPSEDGGYYLIALSHPAVALFAGVAWSTERVFAETLERATAAQLRVHLLPDAHDVDTEDDWRRVEPRL